MLYDAESRIVFAQERADALQAGFAPRNPRARRWLAERLIAAGTKLAPSGKCATVSERSTSRTRAAY